MHAVIITGRSQRPEHQGCGCCDFAVVAKIVEAGIVPSPISSRPNHGATKRGLIAELGVNRGVVHGASRGVSRGYHLAFLFTLDGLPPRTVGAAPANGIGP
jgi:hypothetical protein